MGLVSVKDQNDAYGHQVYDFFKTGEAHEIVERDDGYVGISGGAKAYFREFREWPLFERKAMRFVKGRVLDIGCGAGRHSLYLQKKGFDVVGIDASPLAVKVCKLRGLKTVWNLPITRIGPRIGKFDTILMLGNNFGLFGNFRRAKWLLRRMHSLTSGKARIIAESLDPYDTRDPFHLAYHRLNWRRKRMGGQVRIRVRYKKYATEWFDYLLVSKKEMRRILNGTGWRLRSTLRGTLRGRGRSYIAIMERLEKRKIGLVSPRLKWESSHSTEPS